MISTAAPLNGLIETPDFVSPRVATRLSRACVQLRRERKGIGGGTFGVLDRRGIPNQRMSDS